MGTKTAKPIRKSQKLQNVKTLKPTRTLKAVESLKVNTLRRPTGSL